MYDVKFNATEQALSFTFFIVPIKSIIYANIIFQRWIKRLKKKLRVPGSSHKMCTAVEKHNTTLFIVMIANVNCSFTRSIHKILQSPFESRSKIRIVKFIFASSSKFMSSHLQSKQTVDTSNTSAGHHYFWWLVKNLSDRTYKKIKKQKRIL